MALCYSKLVAIHTLDMYTYIQVAVVVFVCVLHIPYKLILWLIIIP